MVPVPISIHSTAVCPNRRAHQNRNLQTICASDGSGSVPCHAAVHLRRLGPAGRVSRRIKYQSLGRFTRCVNVYYILNHKMSSSLSSTSILPLCTNDLTSYTPPSRKAKSRPRISGIHIYWIQTQKFTKERKRGMQERGTSV